MMMNETKTRPLRASSKRPPIRRTATQSEPEGPWTTGARWKGLGLLGSGGSGGSGKALALAAPPVAGSRARESSRPAGRRQKKKTRETRGGRVGAVSLLAAGCCRPLGPAAAKGAGPPQAPWASAGHTTQTLRTVCVSMVCVRMCQHPLSQPRQPRDCHVLLRNTQTS